MSENTTQLKGWTVVESLPDGTPVAWAPDGCDQTRLWNAGEAEVMARARIWFKNIKEANNG